MPAGTGGLAPLAPEAGGPGPCSRVRGPGLSPGSFNRPRHIQPGCPRTCHLGWGLHCPWPHSLSSPPFRQACRRIPAQAVVHGGVSLPAAVCGGLTAGGGVSPYSLERGKSAARGERRSPLISRSWPLSRRPLGRGLRLLAQLQTPGPRLLQAPLPPSQRAASQSPGCRSFSLAGLSGPGLLGKPLCLSTWAVLEERCLSASARARTPKHCGGETPRGARWAAVDWIRGFLGSLQLAIGSGG